MFQYDPVWVELRRYGGDINVATRSRSASPCDLWRCFAMPTAVPGLWQRTRGRTSCHSEGLSQQGGWYSCKGLPELFWGGGGGGHVGEQEEEHFWPGPVSPLCDMRLSGRGQVAPKQSCQWNVDATRSCTLTRNDDRQQKNEFAPKLHKDIFIKAKLLRVQSSPGVLIEPELIDKSTKVLFSLLNSIYHLNPSSWASQRLLKESNKLNQLLEHFVGFKPTLSWEKSAGKQEEMWFVMLDVHLSVLESDKKLSGDIQGNPHPSPAGGCTFGLINGFVTIPLFFVRQWIQSRDKKMLLRSQKMWSLNSDQQNVISSSWSPTVCMDERLKWRVSVTLLLVTHRPSPQEP